MEEYVSLKKNKDITNTIIKLKGSSIPVVKIFRLSTYCYCFDDVASFLNVHSLLFRQCQFDFERSFNFSLSTSIY